MARLARFTFLVNDDERQLITSLAKKMQRTESDAVRVIVVHAARVVTRQESHTSSPQSVNPADAFMALLNSIGV